MTRGVSEWTFRCGDALSVSCRRNTASAVAFATMPDMPSELRTAFEQMTEKLTDEMFNSWTRGVCDGLEFAARLIERVLGDLGDAEASAREILLPLALSLRHTEMAVLVDGLDAAKNIGDEAEDAGEVR